MFFIKKKKLKLEIYGPSRQLVDLFAPVRMKDSVPEWYKSMPKGQDYNNVSHCLGMRELYSTGIMFPLWSDYEITLGPNGVEGVHWPSNNENTMGAESHPLTEQAPGAWTGYANIKFTSPWWFWCSEPIQWVWTQPAWNQQDPQKFTIVPGSTEFKHQNQTNINTIWKLGKNKRIEKLKAGDPMVHLIPITEQDWDFEVGVMTNEIFSEKFKRWNYAFNKPYQRLRQDYKRL